MTDLKPFIERYVATWNELDADARTRSIPDVWSPDVSLYNASREYHGLAGIAEATQRSCDLFTARGYVFRPLRDATTHHDAIRFDWEMLSPAGERDMLGTQFMIFESSGRIRLDYQFIEH